MTQNDWIRIEVCYAVPEQQWLLALNVPHDCTVEQAVERSGIAEKVPGGLPDEYVYGIWNSVTQADTKVHEGDRVEIYRPLIADPKEARRLRAKKKPAKA